MASIYLIRHGEPELLGTMLGQLDPPLSAAGREQTRRALGGLRVSSIWTSPLRRAKETAMALPSAPIVELPGLREIDYGEWTGRTWEEIERKWPAIAARKSADWQGVPPPGGETWEAFLARVRAAWEAIRRGPAGSAVTAHQGVNAALAHIIDGRNPLEFIQGYGEAIQLEYH